MKRKNYLMALFMLTIGTANASNFVTIKGENLMDANGKKLYIVGTNLGNWLNPEGYMFDFKKTNCEWMINDMVCELAGPDFAREFWQAFKDNYITEADIAYIKQTGANTIRLPFNYKLFTREDYMGKNDETEGFKQMDKVTDWCRKYDLHLILDMHDCPGGQTGGNFEPFCDWKFDDKIMYTCHRYGGEPTKAAIQSIIDFRDKTKLPMYMGEIGHNTDQWQADFCATMKKANIGYTFWPYKKIDGSCMMGIKKPADWDSTIVKFAEADRSSFDAIRKARPDQEKGKKLLMEFVENAKQKNCVPQTGYILSMGLKAE